MSVQDCDKAYQTQHFLCDEMLQGLGRWLRTAGYDTLIAIPGSPDRELIELARSEQRLLITRDRKMAEFKNSSEHVMVLQANMLNECVQELSSRLSIYWLYKPFSRCLLCNSLLIQTNQQQQAQLPDNIRQGGDRGVYCPNCGKLYWSGGHVRRMRHKLEAFEAMGKDGL